MRTQKIDLKPKKKILLKNIKDCIPADVLFNAGKWIIETCVILGKSENYAADHLIAKFPQFEGLDKKSLKVWVETELFNQFALFADYDLSVLYENTLVQHNNIYEALFCFASEYNLSELKLQVMKQREELLKLVSNDPVLYIQSDIGHKLDDDAYDLDRLSNDELIEFHRLISVASESIANQVAFLSPKLIELYETPS